MPRGAKIDRYETQKAYREGRFIDSHKRSFIAIGGCEFLSGEDKSRRYRQVMEKANGLCQGCEVPHYVGAMGEWDHIQGGTSGRCDCLHNARWVCTQFHRKRHVHLMWSKKEPSL